MAKKDITAIQTINKEIKYASVTTSELQKFSDSLLAEGLLMMKDTMNGNIKITLGGQESFVPVATKERISAFNAVVGVGKYLTERERVAREALNSQKTYDFANIGDLGTAKEL